MVRGLTPMAVTSEDGPPVEGNARLVGHLDVVVQPDDRRLGKGGSLRAELAAGAMEQLGLGVEDKEQGPTGGHDAERLEAGVEDERSRHETRLPLPKPVMPIRRRSNLAGWPAAGT